MMNHTRTFMLLAAMTALFMGVGWLLGQTTGMVIAFFVALAMNAYSYWNADTIVLNAYRARPASDYGRDPRVQTYHDDVVRLAERAGLPTPKIYIIPTQQPNAFATGRNPQNAAVAATEGLLAMLSREEIAGVMAHELAHVKNRDTLTMTVTATIAGAIGILGTIAYFFGGGRDRGNTLALLIVIPIASAAAAVVQMAISRAREYEADRIGAEIAGDPRWLASALRKIAGEAPRRENERAEDNPATAHLFIINPLNGKRADNLFSTHPATTNRVARLEAMAAEMGLIGAREQPRGPWG